MEILSHNKIDYFLRIWHFFQIYTSRINISQYFLKLPILQKFAKQKNPFFYWDEILINLKIKSPWIKKFLNEKNEKIRFLKFTHCLMLGENPWTKTLLKC